MTAPIVRGQQDPAPSLFDALKHLGWNYGCAVRYES